MAKLIPFRAIRPTRDKASLIASRSYLTYTKETLREKLENNPFTFLHIINPDFREKKKRKGKNKYLLVKKKFNEFINKKHLIREENECFYIYLQQCENYKYIGIIAAISINDYNNNNIKKHEDTITKRVEMFRDYLHSTGFNADPVLLCHKSNSAISQLINKYQSQRSEYEFTTTNKILHKLWVVKNMKDISKITNEYSKINTLYIADGHHRCASSLLLSKKKKNNNYFMSFLIDDKSLKITSFNRLIKTLNNLSEEEFLDRVNEKFHIKKNINLLPKDKNEIGMYLKGKKYILKLRKKYIDNDCVNKLDTAILSNNILKPILSIKNEKSDENIEFISGNIEYKKVIKLIDEKRYEAAFILKPVTISEIKAVADKNKFMPPKSTYIEPKLRSGLTIFSLK